MKYSDYIEKKRRGSPDFPIQYYYVAPDNPQYVMEAHWHTEFELIRITSGVFHLFLNNVEYCLHAGDVAFIECGCLHRGEPADCIYECLVFDLCLLRRQQKDAAEQYILPIAKGNVGVRCLLKKGDTMLYATVSSLFETMRTPKPFFELQVYGLLFTLFSELYRKDYIVPSAKMPHSSQAKTISRLLDWIDENYTESISLEQLSQLSGLSEKYICRIFKEYTSKTPIGYINELRIENACHEMLTEGKSVTEAAYDCGFNDISYFSKVFKTYKNITPSEFRKYGRL